MCIMGDLPTTERNATCADLELDEDMWEHVESMRHRLTRLLNPAKLTPFLRQCKVIDEQDEDEVLNSTQYPLRINKAGRLIDILRGRGQRGLQAFMELLEFYHPDQYTRLTGLKPTHRLSILLDEEGPEGLSQFLQLEVHCLQAQLRNSRQCQHRMSHRCRVAEEERRLAERRVQELQREQLQLDRIRQEWETGSRELGRLKERLLEQALKYSHVLEEQSRASARERELLGQLEWLKTRLMEAEMQADPVPPNIHQTIQISRPVSPRAALQLPPDPCCTDVPVDKEALLDILRQDRQEAGEQRRELCSTITRLQRELESTEEHRQKLGSQCEQLHNRVRALQIDWETEQKRSTSYLSQIMDLEKERDQALRSRDSLQLEFTDCVLDKDRMRRQIAELQETVVRLQREVERERVARTEQENLHCSHLSLLSEELCHEPCCSDVHLSESTHRPLRKDALGDLSEGSRTDSEECLVTLSERDINRLSTFPFPPCINSIHRRAHAELDLDSWGSDENIAGTQSEPSLSDSFSSQSSHCFPLDFINLPTVSAVRPKSLSPSCPPTAPQEGSLASDITIVGGNRTGIFVSNVRVGSRAEQCGLREGSELLELQQVLFGTGAVQLQNCTSEVAHFSLQWWAEPSSLKHRVNTEAYSHLREELSSPSFPGADSFYVRVNLDMEPDVDSCCLAVSCDDIFYVTDTLYQGRYLWRGTQVEQSTERHLRAGAMPNYNRAQQLLLVRLRVLASEQDPKKKLPKKRHGRVRLVKAVSSGVSPHVLYKFNHSQEENLIPYSMVQPVVVMSKRPIIFSPTLLSRGLIERLLQPADSGLQFNTCHPEPISSQDVKDKRAFLLEETPEQLYGITLESINDIISQDKHCLLGLGLDSIQCLMGHKIYPIVIHIKPKDKKERRFKKFLSGRREDKLLQELCQTDELHLENLPLLHCTVEASSWNSAEELLATIRSTIHAQQEAVVWVEPDKLG